MISSIRTQRSIRNVRVVYGFLGNFYEWHGITRHASVDGELATVLYGR